MYKSFHVKNFRCFKDLQINDLGRVNLIAGKNNSGKTALMEAMYLHSGNRDIKTLLRTDRGAHSPLSPNPIVNDPDLESTETGGWSIVFRDFDTTQEIDLSADVRMFQPSLFGPNESMTVTISIKSAESDDYVSSLDHFRIEEFDLLRDASVLEINANYDRRSTFLLFLQGKVRASRLRNTELLSSEFVFAMERASSRRLASLYSAVRTANRKRWFVKTLSIVEPRLNDVELLYLGGRPVLNADVGLSQPLPFTSLGDGANRFASIMLTMSDQANGAIFIDEIENGIHYSVQKDIWKAIGQVARELDIQVFATTHSYEMIQAAHEAFEDDDPYEFRFHRLNRRSDTDEIEAVTYNEFGVDAAMGTNWEVRG